MVFYNWESILNVFVYKVRPWNEVHPHFSIFNRTLLLFLVLCMLASLLFLPKALALGLFLFSPGCRWRPVQLMGSEHTGRDLKIILYVYALQEQHNKLNVLECLVLCGFHHGMESARVIKFLSASVIDAWASAILLSTMRACMWLQEECYLLVWG